MKVIHSHSFYPAYTSDPAAEARRIEAVMNSLPVGMDLIEAEPATEAQIMTERKACYQILGRTNRADVEITEWIPWFLQCMSKAMIDSDYLLASVMLKARFWQRYPQTTLKELKVVVYESRV